MTCGVTRRVSLQGVSFTIEENKLFCLLGPNGENTRSF